MIVQLMRAVGAAVLVLGLAAAAPAQAQTKQKQETTQAKGEAKAKKEPTAKQKAARERMKECGAEWQAKKKDGSAKGTTWRKFSSECLKRKKA